MILGASALGQIALGGRIFEAAAINYVDCAAQISDYVADSICGQYCGTGSHRVRNRTYVEHPVRHFNHRRGLWASEHLGSDRDGFSTHSGTHSNGKHFLILAFVSRISDKAGGA